MSKLHLQVNSLMLPNEKFFFCFRIFIQTNLFIAMALLNEISLQIFQNKIKISPTVLPVNHAEHL